jgi:hypothetical protein
VFWVASGVLWVFSGAEQLVTRCAPPPATFIFATLLAATADSHLLSESDVSNMRNCSGVDSWIWDGGNNQSLEKTAVWKLSWCVLLTKYKLDQIKGGGRHSSVGIATAYRPNPSGSLTFRTRPDRPWGLPSLLYSEYWAFFPGVKRLGRGANQRPTSSAEVKERLELYRYSSSGPLWPVLRLSLLLSFLLPVGLHVYMANFKSMRWAGHVARMGRRENQTEFRSGNPTKWDQMKI